jgi:hypothetical protein
MNTNDPVWVELTDYGKEVLRQHWAGVITINKPNYESLYHITNGWYRFSLWELMHIYGPHLYNGARFMPFEKNEVQFTDPNK